MNLKLAATLLTLLLCIGCGKPACIEVTRQEAITIDKQFRARVYKETCGEMVWTHVSLVQTRDDYPEEGNVFRIEGDRAISLFWLSNRTLLISYPEILYPAFQAEGTVRGINLVFRQDEPTPTP